MSAFDFADRDDYQSPVKPGAKQCMNCGDWRMDVSHGWCERCDRLAMREPHHDAERVTSNLADRLLCAIRDESTPLRIVQLNALWAAHWAHMALARRAKKEQAAVTVCRCRVCARVLLAEGWVVTDQTWPDEYPGMCPPCGHNRAANAKLARRLADENARRDRRNGWTYGPAPEGEDVFKGFGR